MIMYVRNLILCTVPETSSVPVQRYITVVSSRFSFRTVRTVRMSFCPLSFI